MKTKNLSLAIAAMVIAVGSAVGSYFEPQHIFVRGIMSEGAEYSCIDTQKTCEATGTATCQVTVPLRDGVNSSLATSTANPKTYVPSTACQTVLFTNSTVSQVASLTGNNRPISIE